MGAAVATEEGGGGVTVAVVVAEEVADSAAVVDMIGAAGEAGAGAGAGALLAVAVRGQGRLEAAGEVGAVGLPGAHGRGRAHTTDVEGREEKSDDFSFKISSYDSTYGCTACNCATACKPWIGCWPLL